MPKNKNLNKLFKPKSIAIVGASEKEGKVGNVVVKNILTLGYKGEVFLVNPKYKYIFNEDCYSSLENIPKKVDLAIIIVPAKFVFDVIKKGSKKAKNYVIISAGFSEIGHDGKKREDELLEYAQKNGLNILGPNCLGFIVPEISLNASFAGGMPDPGNIAFVSQSGALAVALMDIARKDKVYFSSLVSIGNKMQLTESELIEYLGQDKKTKVIGLYLEGIKDGKKFMEVVEKVSRKKPIVILKAGKTEKAQKAISSHTGALAGSDEIMNTVFNKLGILRADNLENFIDLLKLISTAKSPKRNENVAVITNAGGPGVLTTDSFKNKKIKLADLKEPTKERMREFLPEESSVENPIDLLGDAKDDRYEKALEALEKEDIGSIIAVLTPQDQTPVDRIAEKIVEFRNKSKKGISTIFIGGERVRRAIDNLRMNGINNFSYPDQAINTLDKFFRWGYMHENKEKSPRRTKSIIKVRKISKIISKAKSDKKKALLFSDAKRIMKMYKIQTVLHQDIKNANEMKIPFPVVLKVDSDKTLHKTDKGGLILGIQNKKELAGAISKMKKNFRGENLIVQPMADIKTEIILGIKKDPVFGPIVVFGLGGIYTEIFKAVDFLVGPLTEKQIKDRLMKSKISFLFEGARGQKPYNIKEFVRILSGVLDLARDGEGIEELDINPLLIYNDGKVATAVDVKIVI